jgi:hypothetical protein
MRLISRMAASDPDHGRDTRPSPSASSVGDRAFLSSSDETPTGSICLKRSASTEAGRIYVEAVLDRYLWLPGTPRRASRHDRRLARALYERGIALPTVQAALLLGAARRSFRAVDAPLLPPVRTLHYFLPLVEEVLQSPLSAGYDEYLESKLRPLAEAKMEQL